MEIPTNNRDISSQVNKLVELIINELSDQERSCSSHWVGDLDYDVVYRTLDLFNEKGYYCYVSTNGIGTRDISFNVSKKPLPCGMLTRRY